jgi:ppGpp synthetase/RelA/SpoT-type nucleotidyltranferase
MGASAFWKEFCIQLREAHDRFKLDTGFTMLASTSTLQTPILPKSFASFVDKTYRKNVVENGRFDQGEPPEGGWVFHDNWDMRIVDIVRTTVLVRYLDGIQTAVATLNSAAEATGIRLKEPEFQSQLGHCAAHVVAYVPSLFEPWTGPRREEALPVEIQFTTQLQSVAGELTHKIYEARRMDIYHREPAWSEDPNFVSNHLPYALHLMDGVILNERRRGR